MSQDLVKNKMIDYKNVGHQNLKEAYQAFYFFLETSERLLRKWKKETEKGQ